MGKTSCCRLWLPAALAAAALAAYPLALRPSFLRWGATDEDVVRPLPGDHFVKDPPYQSTRAITIRATADRVWPWLAQMGQGRGGLYSYDWLEKLVGCDIQSVDRIIPELQELRVGDKVRLVPEDYPVPLAFDVAEIEPGRALVLRTPGDPATNVAAGFPDASWAFVLEQLENGTTRLIVRWRADYKRGDAMAALWNHYGVEPVHFLMEQRMLRGIKERAERVR